MKKLLRLTYFFLIVISVTFGENFEESITFQGEKLINSYENNNMVEYIPSEENLDTWTKMYAFRLLSPENNPNEMINQMNQVLKADNSPYSKVLAYDSVSEKNIHFIAFSTSEGNVYEYNIFRYIDAGEMVISLQLAKRYYVKDMNKEYQDVLDWTAENMSNLKKDLTYLFEDKSILNIIK